MSEFGNALRKGIGAHERAAAARREMDAVLSQASKEVQDVVGAPISLQFEAVDRPTREKSVAESIGGIPAPRETVTMIIAKTPRGPSERLAEAELSEIGYPVTLRWGHQRERASDRSSFELVLARLLESAITGEKIARLLPRPADEAAQKSPP
jgi:hypothetical protein